ncbi:hypothetical protein MCHIJ_45760 [Mycolicibacterium chitae]|nr:hypothetical protein MCHIJ_45760 [Mycolicibacterium chitae]
MVSAGGMVSPGSVVSVSVTTSEVVVSVVSVVVVSSVSELLPQAVSSNPAAASDATAALGCEREMVMERAIPNGHGTLNLN